VVTCSFKVYSNNDWTGTVIYDETLDYVLANQPPLNSHKFDFSTPDLSDVSWIWSVNFVPIKEIVDPIPTPSADIPAIAAVISSLPHACAPIYEYIGSMVDNFVRTNKVNPNNPAEIRTWLYERHIG